MMARTAPTQLLSHWYCLIEDLEASPLAFYTSVEQAIERRRLPEERRSRVDWKERGIFSAKREYLRVRRRDLILDICGAPFGNGFFVSWWEGVRPSGLLALVSMIPLVGPWLGRVVRPLTYYQIDTALMFQEAVHAAVLEAVDNLTSTKGVRALSEAQRKPIMAELFTRKAA